jgi:hypothetical protein
VASINLAFGNFRCRGKHLSGNWKGWGYWASTHNYFEDAAAGSFRHQIIFCIFSTSRRHTVQELYYRRADNFINLYRIYNFELVPVRQSSNDSNVL